MKTTLLAGALLALSISLRLVAVPQEISLLGNLAADTRDLTKDFLDPATWQGTLPLPGFWEDNEGPNSGAVLVGRRVAHLTRAPMLFGERPISAEATYRGQRLERISIYYLEVGTFFGYQPELKQSDQGRVQLRDQENAFQKHYLRLAKGLDKNLREQTKGRGKNVEEGSTQMLRSRFPQYAHGELAIQLRCRERAYVRVDLVRAAEWKGSFLDEATAAQKPRQRAAALRANVQTEGGEVAIQGVPMIAQGGRAYCGISTYLMIAQYLGLQMDSATLASVAGFRYGLRGKKMVEAYKAAADEGQVRIHHAAKFDFERARQSLDAGLPILVWRKYDGHRDRLHSGRSRRGHGALPEPDAKDRATWPGMGEPNHASVITGYHPERREVIFADSWGERARGKRMRVEELEATAYGTFYFAL